MGIKRRILPKQWKHWCQKAGLRRYGGLVSGQRDIRSWLYLQGKGHVWRVNDRGMFQCGDTLAVFDRWALCDIVEVPRPTSMAEFTAAVANLSEQKRLSAKE